MDSAQIAGGALHRNRDEIAERVADHLVSVHGALLESFDLTYETIRQYAYHDISKLFVAVISHRPSLFSNYIQWQRSVFYHRDIPAVAIRAHIDALDEIVRDLISDEEYQTVDPSIRAAYEALDSAMNVDATFVDGSGPYGDHAATYLELIRKRRHDEARSTVLRAVDDGLPIHEAYLQVIQPVQQEIGRLWQINEISVAEEHAATEVSRAVMNDLRSRFQPNRRRSQRILTACLGGELHDMGARMVSDFLYLAGFDSYFTGANTPHRVIIDELNRYNADVIALSATMTLQVRLAIELIDMVRHEKGNRVRVIVGGYAFNQSASLWRDVGADAYAPDAVGAVEQIELLAVPQ